MTPERSIVIRELFLSRNKVFAIFAGVLIEQVLAFSRYYQGYTNIFSVYEQNPELDKIPNRQSPESGKISKAQNPEWKKSQIQWTKSKIEPTSKIQKVRIINVLAAGS